MKLITSIGLLLIAAASLPLRAADGQTVVVKSSSAEDNVVVLHAELAGKETEFRCDINSPPCAAAPAGEYVMVRAEAAEAIYNDCTDVVLYRFTPDAKEKIGVYCWSTSGDCYIASCTPLEIQTVPSSVPDKILGKRPNQMDYSTFQEAPHQTPCDEKPTSQRQMNDCADFEYKEADVHLNKVYQKSYEVLERRLGTGNKEE